ncbi:MAG: O-antigen translocase, partial [Bacteroidales bacterium]
LTGFLVYMLMVYFISKKKFEFAFDPVFRKIFVIQFALVLSCFIVVKLLNEAFYYPIGIILIAISLNYSYKELDKRIALRETITDIYRNIRKREK